jgi:hypothetical protein
MEEAAPVGHAPWVRLGPVDALFLLLTLLLLNDARGTMLDDPGLGWHLRNIDAMRAQGGWLEVDPFCGPRSGERWYTNQWLGDLLLWLGNRWGGLNGMAVVVTVVLALTYRLLYMMLRNDGLPWPAAAAWTWAAALGSYFGWVARPNLFNLLYLLLTIRLCEQFRSGRRSPWTLLWLPPLFVLWANTHAFFVFGLLVLGFAVLVETAVAFASFDPDERGAARRRLPVFVVVTIAATLSTLINPYGWKLYDWITSLPRNEPGLLPLLDEWQSPDFHSPGAFRYEILMLLFPALLAVSRRRLDLLGLLVSVVFLYQALGSRRFVPLWVMAAVPLLARASLEVPWLNECLQRWPLSADMRAFLWPSQEKGAWLGTALVVVAVGLWGHFGEPFAYISPEHIPTTALHRVLELQEEMRAVGKPAEVFHDLNWGGFLTWHGWPNCRTYIDDRMDLQGQAHVDAYFELLRAPADWEERLDRAQIGLVCLAIDPTAGLAPLGQQLQASKQWRLVYRDDYAVIFQRVDPPAH